MNQQKMKLLYLESLRGFAAIIVALYHGNLMFSQSFLDIPLINHGYIMVDFFFVLSGFVIAYNYADKMQFGRDIVTFQMKRFLRLYPLHLIIFLLFVGIECAKYILENRVGIVANNPAFSVNDWGASINNLFLTHAITQDTLTFNDPSWSISAEFYTYLMFACFFYMVQKRYWRIGIGLCMIALSGYILSTYDAFTAMTGLAVVRCAFGFFIGVVSYLILVRWQGRYHWMYAMGGLLLVIIIITMCEKIEHGFLPVMFAMIIGAFYVSRHNIMTQFLAYRPLVFLGTISYGIYMWHVAVWWVISNGLKYGVKVPTAYNEDRGQSFLILNDWQMVFILSGGMLITIGISTLSYYCLEKPISSSCRKIMCRK